MLHSSPKYLAIALVLLCSLSAVGQEPPPLPDEVAAAKNMALIVRLIGGESPRETKAAKYKAKLEADAAAELRKQKRIQLVSDPAKADLVCVLTTFWPSVFFEGKSRWNRNAAERYTHPPVAMMIFPGGSNPHWSGLPLWVLTGVRQSNGNRVYSAVFLIKKFNRELGKNKSSASSGANDVGGNSGTQKDDQDTEAKGVTDSSESSSETAPGSGEPLEQEVQNQAATQAPDSAMSFCQPDFKNCSLPRIIYSAKTLLVCYSPSNCNDEKLRKVVAHWKLVDKPEQADLIMIMSDDIGADAKLPTMYLFQGGAQPDWHAMPLFATVGGGGLFSSLGPDKRDDLLENFQRFIVSSEPSRMQTNK